MGIAMGIAMVLLWYCYGIAMEGLECCIWLCGHAYFQPDLAALIP